MLEVNGLYRRFPGGMVALNNISFSVADGECVVVSGANGSGKSVLMSLIAGLDRPTAGAVRLTDAEGKTARAGLVFQDADAQIIGETPAEDVAFGPRNMGFSRAEAESRALAALSTVGLIDKKDHSARTLSGGEKRRLAVAGILAMDAPLVIFDEPFANLDWPGVCQVTAVIRKLHSAGKTVIILTHELEKILALADRLLILFHGTLVYDGDSATALNRAELASWGIRNPLRSYETVQDLFWGEV